MINRTKNHLLEKSKISFNFLNLKDQSGPRDHQFLSYSLLQPWSAALQPTDLILQPTAIAPGLHHHLSHYPLPHSVSSHPLLVVLSQFDTYARILFIACIVYYLQQSQTKEVMGDEHSSDRTSPD